MPTLTLPSRHERAFPRCAGMKLWLSSFAPLRDPLQADEPWVTYPAISWLLRRLTPSMRGFEFGSGGSTLFFARRVEHITAAEHHNGWAQRVRDSAHREALDNVNVIHTPPDRHAPSRPVYQSRHYGHHGVSYESYARTIDAFDDHSLDFVFVDGRSRVACVAHAAKKVRPGGYLILDNAERRRYQPAHDMMSRHRRLDFKGVGPRVPWRFRTTVWRIAR